MQFISGIVVVRVDEYDMIVCGFFFPVFISFFFAAVYHHWVPIIIIQ